ncbi:MAG: hypothetical protein IJK58_08345, partial [Clostridia bacterium]|nr:hypothetical protein [Clostridia bacterium]
MKKVLSLILAAAFVFALAFSFSGCDLLKQKTPSERFIEARDNIGLEARVGPLEKKYEIDDVNYADLTAEIDAPQIIGDDPVTVTFKGGVDADEGNLSAELGARYRTSELRAKAEIEGRETVYISFPGMSDKVLWGKMNELAETAGDAASMIGGRGNSFSLDSLLDKDKGVKNKVENLIDEIVEKYVTDESVAVETEDVEVLGETVRGAEKLSVSLNAEQLKEIEDKIKDTLGDIYEIDDFNIGEDAAANMTLWVSRRSTVRAELVLSDSENEAKAVYEMRSESGKVRANLDITATEDGTVTTVIPLRYEHEEERGHYEGRFGIDESKLVLPEDSDYDIGETAISVEFEGTASSGSADMTYTVRIGAGGTTVKVPVNVKISKAGSGDNVEITVDAKVIGVKLTVKGVVSHSAVRTDRYDLSRAVELSENMSDEDADKLDELGEELSNKLGDFTDLVQTVMNNVSGGFGLDYDDYDDYDD